ncbi:hypothetical protein, partial [Xanthovirga aplysinae]|uniref:hypothetical protein n=1 Tax=Xanthovirga aplysinae TaxID=2529853 RepID=UPI0016571C69
MNFHAHQDGESNIIQGVNFLGGFFVADGNNNNDNNFDFYADQEGEFNEIIGNNAILGNRNDDNVLRIRAYQDGNSNVLNFTNLIAGNNNDDNHQGAWININGDLNDIGDPDFDDFNLGNNII